MAQGPLPPPPLGKDSTQDGWFYLLWKRVNSTGQLLWSYLDFTGSDLADLEHRSYHDLQDKPPIPVLPDDGLDEAFIIPGPRGIPGPQGERGPVFMMDEVDSESNWFAPGLPPPINSTGIELRQEVTGLIRGGILSATPGGTTFNITAGIGQVIDNYTNPELQFLTPVTWTAFTNVADTNLADEFNYIYINSAGAVVQSTSVPTNQDLRTALLLGVVVHSMGVISAVGIQLVTAYNNGNLAQDLFSAIGPITNGCTHSGVVGALSVARTAGTIYRRGSGYSSGFQTPNEVALVAVSPATIETFCRNGSNTVFSSSPAGTTFAVNVYDNGGAASAGVPSEAVSVNRWQAIRIFLSPNNHSLLQYGQVTYNSVAAAQAGVNSESFFIAPVLTRTSFRGFLFVRGGATDLSLAGDAVFVAAGKLGDTGSIGAPGVAGATGASGPSGPAIFLPSEDSDEPMIVPGRSGADGVTGAAGPAGPAVFLPQEENESEAIYPPGGTAQGGTPAVGNWVLPFAAAHG